MKPVTSINYKTMQISRFHVAELFVAKAMLLLMNTIPLRTDNASYSLVVQVA